MPRDGVPSPVLDVHFREPTAAKQLATALGLQFRSLLQPERYLPVFFLVGATSSTGDSLGPFIGWFLKRKGFTGEYVGDLENPVHATNLRGRLFEAWAGALRREKLPYLIAVDAAVGRPGRITLNRGPLRPGAAMGKSLPRVGQMHIMGGTANFPFMIWFAGLDQTVGMAEVIADGLLAFWDDYESGRLFAHRRTAQTVFA
ncbi:putative sporulation protein YyaC [Symbiobacterium terraclitae]|uniref:Sporulation protein YyaC n=1 Tax=Symbiobacterium terraclitae TaxID=557451 RepID=A0ABS4JPB7_9FIRM|nr:putative sporulation protein YyaC [Symbiobacterium terraclitae]